MSTVRGSGLNPERLVQQAASDEMEHVILIDGDHTVMSVEEDTHDSSTIVLKLGSYEGRLAEDLPSADIRNRVHYVNCSDMDVSHVLPDLACLPNLLALVADGCELSDPESLTKLSVHPSIRYLDLSFCEGVVESGFSHPTLTHLVLQDAGLDDSALLELAAMPQLTHLDLSSNDITETETLTAVAAAAPRLISLNVNENPIQTRAGLRNRAMELWPALARLNGDALKTGGTTGVADVADDIAAGPASTEHLEGRLESCSCLEGNACEDRYGCKDWANRHKIAAAVRARRRPT